MLLLAIFMTNLMHSSIQISGNVNSLNTIPKIAKSRMTIKNTGK